MTRPRLPTRPNYLRRAFGAAICLSVPLLFLASLISGLRNATGGWFVGAWPLIWSGLVGALNFHLSFVRGWLHKRRHGSMDGYRFVSGFPLVGYLGLVVALYLGWGAPGTAMIGLAICFLDTGGLVWFLLATWRDSSLWGSRATHAESAKPPA